MLKRLKLSRKLLFHWLLLCSAIQEVLTQVPLIANLANQCPVNMVALFEGVSCTLDTNCQTLATGFFCYQGHCCAQTNPPPSGYGSACTLNEHCKFTNSECRGNICYCRLGFNYNGQDCLPQGSYDPRPNAGCASGQITINGRCFSFSGYGGFCDYSRQCNYPGALCYQKRCVCPPGQLFNGQQCINDPNIPNVLCPSSHVRINGECLPLVGVGERCMYDLQCRSRPGDRPMYCGNFVCRFVGGGSGPNWDPSPEQRTFPKCRNPSAEVELLSGIPKDCIYQRCAPGYHCEWNSVYKGGQYICCGISPENPIYGQPKMYPGYANLPLQCTALNSCTFVDFPYCVWSESYRHKVCCSRPQCI